METSTSSLALAKELENDLIMVGSMENQRVVYDMPFPLVLVPRKDKLNFV